MLIHPTTIINVILVCITSQRTAHSASGVRGENVPRRAVTALSLVTERARVRLVEERVVIHMHPSTRNVHAGKSAALVS